MASVDECGPPVQRSGFGCGITEGHMTRQDLQDLRRALEMSVDGIAWMDADGCYEEVNPAYAAMLGRGVGEFAGRHWRDFAHAEDCRVVAEAIAEALRCGRAQCEMRVRRSDGSVVHCLKTMAIRHDEQGRPAGHYCFMTDITARMEAERALRLSEERYRAMIEMQTEYICRWTPDGRLTFVNEAYARCVGTSREQLIGGTFMPMIHEEDWCVVQEAMSRLTAANPTTTVEHRVIMHDRSIRWHRWTTRGIFGPAGEVAEYQSVGTDITELHGSAQELRVSMSRFQTLAELAPVAIFQTDEHDANVYVNERWMQLTGLSYDEGLGYGWRRAIHPDDAHRVGEMWRHRFEEGGLFSTEYRYRRPDGSVVSVFGVATQLKDETGRVTGVLGAALDISALKAAQEELSVSLEQQKELAGRERSLRRELDHRVRNNLAALLGLIRFYTRSGDPEAFEKIEGKVRAMGEVHDMIVGSEGRDVEIGQIVRRLAVLILGEAASHRVVIQTSQGAIPSPKASALAMIVQELLTNSFKHGAMAVDGQADQTRHIRVQWGPTAGGKGFMFTWQERGGSVGTVDPADAAGGATEPPRATAGAREGLGLTLIRGLARSELQGHCEFEFQPEGLRFELCSAVPLFVRESEPILSFSRS